MSNPYNYGDDPENTPQAPQSSNPTNGTGSTNGSAGEASAPGYQAPSAPGSSSTPGQPQPPAGASQSSSPYQSPQFGQASSSSPYQHGSAGQGASAAQAPGDHQPPRFTPSDTDSAYAGASGTENPADGSSSNKKNLLWVILGCGGCLVLFLILAVLGVISFLNAVDSPSASPTSTATSAPTLEPAESESPSPSDEATSEATEQEGSDDYDAAMETAESYMEYTSLSRAELLGQLEYEGFSTATAQKVIEEIDVDWNEIAKERAEFLDSRMNYSLKRIEEAMGQPSAGFTAEEIAYALENGTFDQMSAAAEYAKVMRDQFGYNDSKIRERLESDGFTAEEVQHAMDSL